jgi:hypothetical protein
MSSPCADPGASGAFSGPSRVGPPVSITTPADSGAPGRTRASATHSSEVTARHSLTGRVRKAVGGALLSSRGSVVT